jgi:hypothetical protein
VRKATRVDIYKTKSTDKVIIYVPAKELGHFHMLVESVNALRDPLYTPKEKRCMIHHGPSCSLHNIRFRTDDLGLGLRVVKRGVEGAEEGPPAKRPRNNAVPNARETSGEPLNLYPG